MRYERLDGPGLCPGEYPTTTSSTAAIKLREK